MRIKLVSFLMSTFTPSVLSVIKCSLGYFQIQHCSTSDHKGWLGSFKIPDQFSRATMERLEKKEITDATRNEIIALPIYQQTTHPTSEEYTRVCKMLIEKYPILKDSCGNGYVSSTHAHVPKNSSFIALNLELHVYVVRKYFDILFAIEFGSYGSYHVAQ